MNPGEGAPGPASSSTPLVLPFLVILFVVLLFESLAGLRIDPEHCFQDAPAQPGILESTMERLQIGQSLARRVSQRAEHLERMFPCRSFLLQKGTEFSEGDSRLDGQIREVRMQHLPEQRQRSRAETRKGMQERGSAGKGGT